MTSQGSITTKAIFKGYNNGIFHFIDDSDYIYEFHEISDDAKESFNLFDNKFINETFYITYITETEIDKFDQEEEINSIIGLELVKSTDFDIDLDNNSI